MMTSFSPAFFDHLPNDITQMVIRKWIFPAVVQEFWQREHRLCFFAVLYELRECFPEELWDEYIVSEYGTCVLMFPRMHFFLGRSMYARLEAEDARRLQVYDNCCFFSVGHKDDIPDGSGYVELCLHSQYGRESYSITFAKQYPGMYRQCVILPSGWVDQYFALRPESDTHRRFRNRHLSTVSVTPGSFVN